MSFFSQKDYLERARSADEMRMRQTAPLLARPTSPERKLAVTLEGIPEATPGPNAFAMEAARLERHRLDSNAFYQQEVQRRKVTPLTSIHPALRPRSNSDPPTPPRLSSCTTMSPFVNAGKEKENSPPLKLVPGMSYVAEPTERGCIEEHREQVLHARSGSKDERIPVFIPTPKMSSNAFAKQAEPAATRVDKQKEATIPDQPTKTPKKSLFEKLRLTTNMLGISSPAAWTHDHVQLEADTEEKMPVKAKAVFGTSPPKGKARTSLGPSPSKSNLPRSPSKRKGFFSRKNSEIPSINASKAAATRRSADYEHQPTTASTVVMTPPTAHSDPTHYSYQGKRLASQAHSDQSPNKEKEANQCLVTRSQSLKYFDHVVPPTPPTKDTPPDEKAKKEAALKAKSSRVPFHDDQTTPSKSPTGVVSTSDRLSPTKFGGYGHRETATLITRPSMYSLHASVVPNLTEASTFEEMKARIDGLGLEGFNMPPENTRSPDPAMGYTPSIYSTQFSPRPNSAFARISPATPHGQFHSKEVSTDTKSSSSNGEIPVYYPGLAKDPSFNNMIPAQNGDDNAKTKKCRRSELLDTKVPWHGYTHSRDHSRSPRHSVSSLFARPVEDDLNEVYYDSPTSFSHASATPSPLQFLPATTYTPPPPRRSSKRPLRQQQQPIEAKDWATENTPVTNPPARTSSTSPTRGKGVFENAPSLPAQGSKANSRNGSPENSLRGVPTDADINVDPLKISPGKSPSGEKLDRMIHMLNQLKARNGEINTMRDEMRASNARLDQRLSAVEGSQRASPMPPSSDESVDEWGMRGGRDHHRVSTNVAHDFYRFAQAQLESEEGVGEDAERVESTGTIAKLMETNRRLLEMCGGFADKIKELEEKVNRKA